MPTALLKKAVLARDSASCEYQHQNILATGWKIEELRRHIDLVETLQEENEGCLDKAPEDLKLFESFLLVHSLAEIRTGYMALVYALTMRIFWSSPLLMRSWTIS